MPAEFQKSMYYTLIGLKNTFFLLNKILIISVGLEEEYKHYDLNCLKRSDDEDKPHKMSFL